MQIQVMPGIAGLIIGLILQKYSFDGEGNMKGKTFLFSVSIGIISQIYLVYEYIELRGGFKIHNCIYGVFFALLFGALVLWASRMLYAFDHEGFRVLLGVGAITSGWLMGNGFDLIVAWNQGTSIVENALSVYIYAIGAVSVFASGAALALKVFSLKPLKIYDTISFTSMAVGIILIFAASVF